VVKGGLVALWLFDVYPANWIGDVPDWQQLCFITMAWFGIALSLGIPYTLIGWCGYALKTSSVYMRALALPFTVLCAEIAGSLLFSVYTYTPLVGLSFDVGFGTIGYTLAHHAVLRLFAPFGGVYTLTLLLGFVAALMLTLHTLTPWKWRSVVVVVGVVLFVATGWIQITPTNRTSHTIVATVGTTFEARAYLSGNELTTRQDELLAGVRYALAQGAEVVLLPEDARLGERRNALLHTLQSMPHAQNAVVIDSYRTTISSSSVVLRGYAHDLTSGTTYTSDKRVLVPMGEFLPLLHKKIISLLGGAELFTHMQYIPGTEVIPSTAPEHIPHMLFCFESGAPTVAKEKARSRAAALMVHPVSHAWFHTPHTLWNQERSMLIVQSLYTGLPIVQAGNLAPSFLYTPDGVVHTGQSTEVTERVSVHMFAL
jgi:apolipoprotein N-acyltransferase